MVKKIPLSQEKYALVDDEDFEWLNQWKWYAHYNPTMNKYYAQRNQHLSYTNGKQITKAFLMHRAIIGRILGRELKRNEFVDHINHDTLKNTRENLRIVSNRQNQHNQNRETLSKYSGVTFDKSAKKWVASIQLNGKNKYLGSFENEITAAKAYEMVQRLYFDENLICKLNKESSYKTSQKFTPKWKLKTYTSRYKGVDWDKSAEKWRARIQVNNKRKQLGLFNDEKEAANAYNVASKKYSEKKLACKLEE